MKVLNRKLVRRYKVGYELWDEEVEPWKPEAFVISDPDGGAQEMVDDINAMELPASMVMRVAYTPDGHYIGNNKTAHYLCKKRGISPTIIVSHNVCSIGFCETEQKWYGWSHRAIYGFGVGDVVKEGDCCASSGWTDEYLEENPKADLSLPVGFRAQTLDDAKRMAIAFAESVG